MNPVEKIRSFFRNDWGVTALVLLLFLITNRYIYGWDDQHLEIPLLKHLIDPALYQGDYYVESLKANFTSFLYPLLSRFITVDQVPSAYLVLYLLSRYFMFFFLYRLWKTVSGRALTAFAVVLGMFLLVRPEEFIYRTFSHQEFSYIFAFGGLYLVYRQRFLWAALVYGLGANFHALYLLFPMTYLGAYLLFFHRERRWELIFKTSGLFILGALPFLGWTVVRALTLRTGHGADYYNGWVDLYHLSCPQNFLFGTKSLAEAAADLRGLYADLSRYFFLAALFLFNWRFNVSWRQDAKAMAMTIAVVFFILLNFVFTYFFPSHFVLDLNLVRNEQYLTIFLGGYTVLMAVQEGWSSFWTSAVMGVLLLFLGGKDPQDTAVVLALAAVFECLRPSSSTAKWLPFFIGASALAFFAAGGETYSLVRWQRLGMVVGPLAILAVVQQLPAFAKYRAMISKVTVLPVFLVAFGGYCILHYTFYQVSTHGGGFWQLQRNWEDMQYYVKDHTPKNAIVLAPNDMEMGGFRIHSNRRIVVCYRDCGIIGFDYGAAKEWQQRMADTEEFKVMINKSFARSLINGISKYGATHVVFMRYAAPPENALLKKMYENEAFALYEVVRQ